MKYNFVLNVINNNVLLDDDIDYARSILKECDDLYYNGINDESFLSDLEYDKFHKICHENINFGKKRIGSSVRGGKIKLPFILGSLDQVYENDCKKWVEKNNWQNEYFVISDKQDGTSGASIHSEIGLDIAYSRGDGYFGADITRHIEKISNYPNVKKDIKIRYEVVYPYKNFYSMKNEVEKNGNVFYKNPRNYTAGKMNSESAPLDFYENVKVIVTSIIDSNLNKSEQYKLCEKLNFKVTPWILVKGSDLTDEFLTKYLIERKNNSDTELDGIVIDLDSSKLRNSLDWDSENPPYSRKFKISDNGIETKVTNVIYRVSKDGYLKPRIEISPVDISGVTITYCTGFNCGFIRDNNINIGSIIKITRQGDVIPHCSEIITKSLTPLLPDENDFGKMEWTETGVDLVLIDKSTSKEYMIGRLLHFSNTLKIAGLKKGLIKKLVDSGIDTIIDVVKLSLDDLKNIIGESAGETVFNSIKNIFSNIRFEKLIDASQTLGRGVGESTGKIIIENMSFDDFINKNFTIEDLEKLPDIGNKTAELIFENHGEFVKFYDQIKDMVNIVCSSNGDLVGIEFLMTGIRDNLLQESIISRGGKMCSTVSAKKDMYLICADVNASSSKISKAREVLQKDRIIDIAEARKRWL